MKKTCELCREAGAVYIVQESVDVDGQEQLVDVDVCPLRYGAAQ